MNVLCIIKPSAGLYAGVGRSLCRRRPVSMPASAGLYAGLYAGQPLFDCVAVPSGGFFSGKTASRNKNYAYLLKNDVFLYIVAMLANVDLNLRLTICKIAI